MTRIRDLERRAKDAERDGRWNDAAVLWAEASRVGARRALVAAFIGGGLAVCPRSEVLRMTRLLLIFDARYCVARWCGAGHVRAVVFAARGCWREWRAPVTDAQGRERLGL